MNWDAVGAIGEVVGAVGVVITLVYLARQIRKSSIATRSEDRQSLAEQQVRLVNSRATDPFLRAAIEKVYAGDLLNTDETFGVRSHCLAHVRLFENYFAQYELGSMRKEDWMAMPQLIARHLSLAPYEQAFESIRNSCNVRIVEEVDCIMNENNR